MSMSFHDYEAAKARNGAINSDFDYYVDVNEAVARILEEATRKLSALDLENVPSAIPNMDLRDIIPALDDMMPDATKHADKLLRHAKERHS